MGLAEADFAHAILKTVGAADDLDLDAHEVDREIAAVNFWKPHGVLLGGNDGLGLALFASIDGVDHFLLGKTMMIGKALGINQLRPEVDQALLKAVRLRDPAERSHLPAF